jgi:membrane-associated phospholipid phosphatase
MEPRFFSFALCIALLAPGAAVASDDTYSNTETDHPVQLGRKLVVNVLGDQKTIWTSPFHVNRKNAKYWMLFGAATAALVATDRQTSTLLKNAPTQVRWGNNISDVGAVYTVVPIAAGFYLGGAFTDNAKARETGVLGAEALLDSLIVQSVLKPIAGRNRPNSGPERHEWFDGGASFPSGHSIESWALASVVAHEYSDRKWVPFVAYGLASVVGAARFTAQQHYASDILAGGAMGWFIGRYVVESHGEHVGHGFKPKIAPILSPSARTYGLSVTLAR